MLQHLSIKDFILIDNLELDFCSQLNILTGETGSGKSMLLNALQLLMGERAQADLVNSGAEIAFICAEFNSNLLANQWLVENGFMLEEDIILIKRSIDKVGKNRAQINGMAATGQQLRKLSQYLIEMQSQHIQQELLHYNEQRNILDSFCNSYELLEQVTKFYNEWKIAEKQLEELKQQQKKKQENTEYLNWILQDIQKLNPLEQEWQSLQDEHKRLQHANDIIQNLQSIQDITISDNNSMHNLLKLIQQKLNDINKFDDKLNQINQFIEVINIQVNELEIFIEKYLQKIDIDPSRLLYINERMQNWITLARRLKVNNDQLYDAFQELQQQQNNNTQENIIQLQQKLEICKNVYLEHAKDLSKLRTDNAIQLCNKVNGIIHQLAMAEAEFNIIIEESEVYHEYGIDKINFVLKTHKQTSYKNLAKVASGGELSRIALALILANQQHKSMHTLVFDEIDSGISGITAQKIGGLLAKIAQKQQVLCITHLAQVASFATQHISVNKITQNNVTKASINILTDEQRLYELARLIGGEVISQETLQHAKNMIEINNKNYTSL